MMAVDITGTVVGTTTKSLLEELLLLLLLVTLVVVMMLMVMMMLLFLLLLMMGRVLEGERWHCRSVVVACVVVMLWLVLATMTCSSTCRSCACIVSIRGRYKNDMF